MTRHSNWQTLLHDFLMERDEIPFHWGVSDCALFSCDAILRMTGQDIAADFRNRYRTELGSLRIIRKITGGRTVEATARYAAAKYGMPEIHPRMAGRGDLVLMPNGNQNMLAIVALNGKEAAAVSEAGLTYLPLNKALAAWKV